MRRPWRRPAALAGGKRSGFELVEQLGYGGFGAVWKAKDPQLDRIVAIKIPRRQLNREETEKFLREARTAAQLVHPNIVNVHEVGLDGDLIYIVSDFIEGLSLGDRLTGKRMTYDDAVGLALKIADVLHFAHTKGVVHRDLKPSNIMLDSAGEPHLMDFGLARREMGEITMTTEGQIVGTPAYMSPEQARGEAHVADRRSDIYSLGVILFELLTGERPFRGNVRMLIKQVIEDEAHGSPIARQPHSARSGDDLHALLGEGSPPALRHRRRTGRRLAALSGGRADPCPAGGPRRVLALVPAQSAGGGTLGYRRRAAVVDRSGHQHRLSQQAVGTGQ